MASSIGTAIVEVARARWPGGPPPHGLPYFGIDHASGTALRLLDELTTRGIFRKYEHVLDLGSGLGATTRYLVTRLGCSATGTASTVADATVAHELTRRASLDWHATHLAADATRLPFAPEAFTHVWIVESLPRLGPVAAVLAEATRVLRPGGHFGMQDLAITEPDAALAAAGFATVEERAAALAATGLVEITVRDLTVHARDDDARSERAWHAFAERRGADDAMVRERSRLADGLSAGRLRVVQLTARRP